MKTLTKTQIRTLMTALSLATSLSLIAPALAQTTPTEVQPADTGNKPALTHGEKPLFIKHNLQGRAKNQSRRIEKKLEAGKITEEQSAVEQKKVAQIEEHRLQMIHENGEKPLNKKQRKVIRHELNQNAKELKATNPQ